MPSKPHDITQGFREPCQGAPSYHEAESTASLKQGGDSLHIKWNSKNKKTPGLDIPIIKFRYQVQGSHTDSYFLQGRGKAFNTNSQSTPHPAYWDFSLPKVPQSAMPLTGTRGRSTSKALLTPPSFKQHSPSPCFCRSPVPGWGCQVSKMEPLALHSLPSMREQTEQKTNAHRIQHIVQLLGWRPLNKTRLRVEKRPFQHKYLEAQSFMHGMKWCSL